MWNSGNSLKVGNLVLKNILLLILIFSGANPLNASPNLAEIKSRFNALYEQRKYREAYETSKGADFRGDIEFLTKRSGLFFLQQNEQFVSRCDAVRDFEEIAKTNATLALPFLDALYGGDWVLLAAHEGNSLARIRLFERINTATLNKGDTLYKLNKIQYYRYLFGLLNFKSERSDIEFKRNNWKNFLILTARNDGIDLEQFSDSKMKTVAINCPARID